LYCKVMHLLFHIDDSTEAEVGEDHHGTYVTSIGELTNKIFQHQFDSADDVKRDKLHLTIVQISKSTGIFMELLYDCAIDLKQHFGMTKDLGQHFSRIKEFTLQNL
ncbi:unnamed protein product, partial [Allacma fusca]